MFECLSSRLTSYVGGHSIRGTREFPLQVGVGLTLHRQLRSAKVIDYVGRLGLSVNCVRVKAIENDIAKAVMKRVSETDGLFIHPKLQQNRFTHYAADNLDFAKTHLTVKERYMQQSLWHISPWKRRI